MNGIDSVDLEIPIPGPLTRALVLPVLKGLPPIRAIKVIHSRGVRSFTLRMGTGLMIGPNEDSKVSELLLAMFEQHGYGRSPRTGFTSFDLADFETDRWHNQHLIVAGGPSQNPITEQLINTNFLHHIAYYGGVGEGTMTRAFMWRNRLYTGSAMHDYGVIAVRPHPYNPAKRIALIFGFGAMGTLGAVRAFSDPAYTDLRKQLSAAHGCVDGSLRYTRIEV